MSRKISLTIMILLLTLSACTPNTIEPTQAPGVAPTEEVAEEPVVDPVPENMSFTDDMGNVLEYADYPQSIVSLSPNITEILFAIGAGDSVSGREDMSFFPAEALDIPSIGSLWGDLPIEAILALEPDLVIAAEIISAEQVNALQDLDIQVYWQANPLDFDGLFENINALATLTGHEEEAKTLVTDLATRVQKVEERALNLSAAPLVFYELDSTDPSAPWTTGSGTFIDYIITMAGGVNAAAALEGEYTQISAEELITVNPQVILLGDAMYGTTLESVGERAGWDVISAVETANIHPIDPNILSVPGPRLVDGLEEVFKLIHPIIVDYKGNDFYVAAPYAQIVSLSPNMTEILFAIGAGDQVVGRDDYSLYPAEAADISSIGSLWGDLPVEAILALEPDLVVAAEIISQEQVKALEDLGLTVFWQANPNNFVELNANLLDFGVLTGHRAEATSLIGELEARVAAVQMAVMDATETPTVFYELDATDPSNPWTTGSGTFIDFIIKMAGGENAAASLEGEFTQISAEELISVNPDIILLSDALYGVTPEIVSERAGWDVITAVINGEIYPIDPNMMSVPGPRLVDALEETAMLLHPELFE